MSRHYFDGIAQQEFANEFVFFATDFQAKIIEDNVPE
jgi:hypothetical protein